MRFSVFLLCVGVLFAIVKCNPDNLSVEYLDTSVAITSENILYTNDLAEMADSKSSELNYVWNEGVVQLEIVGYCPTSRKVVVEQYMKEDTLFILLRHEDRFQISPSEEVVPFRVKIRKTLDHKPKGVELVGS